MAPRTIVLLDANAFFASCAAAADPTLRGKPVVVAGDPQSRRGIVLAVSYEARRLATAPIRAGMPLAQALRSLPRNTILVPPDYRLYTDISRRMFAVMRRYTPLVEGASIDEAWMDWTGCLHLHGHDPIALARTLKAEITRELAITVSVGIAWSKVTAKVAAELQKPDGLTCLQPPDWVARVWPLPAGHLYGVGPRTAEKLKALNIFTIGDLARAEPARLRQRLGIMAGHLIAAAAGQDEGLVDPHAHDAFKSIGHSLTLPEDVGERTAQRAILLNLADQVGRRLRRHGLMGRTVQLTVRDSQFHTITRARTLDNATDTTRVIYDHACQLLAAHWPVRKPIRLLGVSISQLLPVPEAVGQLTLFSGPDVLEKQRRADLAADALRDKFGEEAVVRGGQLITQRGQVVLDKRQHGTSFEKDRVQRRPGDPDDT